MSTLQKPIIFVDTVCPKPYSPDTLAKEGLGGTEATVIRVAEGLSAKHSVWVMQHNRTETEIAYGAIYKPLKPYVLQRGFQAKAFIVLRQPEVAINLKRLHPDTPVWVWLHDLIGRNILDASKALGDAGIGIITVSDYHKLQLVDRIKHHTDLPKWPRIKRVYNPIDDGLKPNGVEIDRNKLTFFSSPHKGLPYALETFKAARRLNPDFRLYIANPGYYPSNASADEGVINLGVLSHRDAIGHVRSSLCVFYPNHVYPETFGLVLAEANAVGTPVLTHPLGAASEVLDDRRQLIDTRDLKLLVDTLLKWREDRPVVQGKDEFRLTAVLKQWEDIL